MKQVFELNFLPTYSYRYYIFGLIGTVLCFFLILSVKVFNLSIISFDVLKILLASFLSILIFSSDSKNSTGENKIPLKYYAGKVISSSIIGFCIGIKITELIANRTIPVDFLNITVVGMIGYVVIYNTLKLLAKEKESEIVEVKFPDNIKNNPVLSWLVLIFSVLSDTESSSGNGSFVCLITSVVDQFKNDTGV